MANVYDMTDTWNNAGTVFTAIKMAVTDTASQSTSNLLDLLVGANSRFRIQKDGIMVIKPQTASSTAIIIDAPGTTVGELIECQNIDVRHWLFGGGGGSADDFVVFRYNDSGTFQDQPLTIVRATGRVSCTSLGGLGYGTGQGIGGTVTQITSRTTAVTLDKLCGEITLFSAAGSATFASFTVNCNKVLAGDIIILNQISGTDKYRLHVTKQTVATSFEITFATTGGTTTEQPVFRFMILRGTTN